MATIKKTKKKKPLSCKEAFAFIEKYTKWYKKNYVSGIVAEDSGGNPPTPPPPPPGLEQG